MILQEKFINVGTVESRVRPSVRPVSRCSMAHNQRRRVHVRIGRIHLLSGCEMAELLDDRDEVIVVLPLKQAQHAVAACERH